MKALEYKRLRKQLGTQADAASWLGVTRETIVRRESGEQPIGKEAELAIRWAVQERICQI